MIYGNMMGGLGNQLFQIFTTIAYAMQYNQPFSFPLGDQHSNRRTHWNDFLIDLAPFTVPSIPEPTYCDHWHGFHYHEIPYLENDVTLFGWFQSELYFRDHFEAICEKSGVREKQVEVSQTYLEDYFQFHLSDDVAHDKEVPYISIHFRIGDYKHFSYNHPILNIDYYRNALSKMCTDRSIEHAHILYFCEEEDNDTVKQMIDQLSVQFFGLVFHKVADDIINWKQMLLMSLCHHHIIANSSYSWWGAYFNKRTDKMVCYPSVWFGYAMSHCCTKDVCPSGWTKIEV